VKKSHLMRQRYTLTAVGLAFAAIVALPVVSSAQPATQPVTQPTFTLRDEDVKNFPEGAGRDETFYFCTACHAFKIVTQQGMTLDQWNESLNWMTERHKMPELKGKDRDVILAYLATHYAPKAQTGSRGWQNPFAPQ